MSILNKNRIFSLLLALLVMVVMTCSVFAIQIAADESESDTTAESESTEESESTAESGAEQESESGTEQESESSTASESESGSESSTETTAAPTTNDNSSNGVNVGQIVSYIVLGILVIGVVVFCIIRREKVGKYVRALNSERKKIVWYPWPQTMKSTAVVVVVVLVIAAVIAALDFAFSQGVNALNSVI